MGRTLAFAVMPQITDLMNKAAGWAADNREVIATKLDEFLQDVGGFLDEIGAHEETFASVFGAAVWAAERTLALAGALKDIASWTKEIMAGGLYGGEGLAGTYGTIGNMGLDDETKQRIVNRQKTLGYKPTYENMLNMPQQPTLASSSAPPVPTIVPDILPNGLTHAEWERRKLSVFRGQLAGYQWGAMGSMPFSPQGGTSVSYTHLTLPTN